jgi:hypothetical protein
MHLYLVADCKTPGCRTAHNLRYLGEVGKVPDEVQFSVPVPFLLHCPNCDLTHDYATYHIRKLEMEQPPPSWFEDKLLPPPDQT